MPSLESFRAVRMLPLGILAATALIPSLQGEVRLLTLGIDVNCPPGLGECWGQGIGEGVARLEEIASISDEADGSSQTVEVRSRGDRLIDWHRLAAHLESIQMGARLRSIEATVDGWLEPQGDSLALRLSGTGEILRLAPLTQKTQWDRRKESPFPISSAERLAFEGLRGPWRGDQPAVRVTGPLRTAAADEPMILEVREWHRFGCQPPAVLSLSIGLSVNSPYGLGEPWAEARENLEQFSGIERVAELPDLDASTAQVALRGGRLPDPEKLREHLTRAGIGAELTGFEATLEGRLVREHGQLWLQVNGSGSKLGLGPLTRKVSWDYRLRRESPASSVERGAYARLGAEAGRRGWTVRVTGPLLSMPGQAAWLLEVREFDLNPGAGPPSSRGRSKDRTPPVPLQLVRTIALDGGSVFLDWANSDDPDLAGYNVYRGSQEKGPFKKINKTPILPSEYEVRSSGGQSDYYAITVLDRAGNESARSPVSDARPPAAPKNLTARPGDASVFLVWEENREPDFDSYAIHRSEEPGGPYAEVYVGLLNGRFTDQAVENGKAYYYTVTAVDVSSNQSDFSNESSAWPAAPSGVSPRASLNPAP